MNNYITVGHIAEDAKLTFYKKTYTHLALGVLAFILVEYVFINTPILVKAALSLTGGKMWFFMLGGFMIVTNYAEKLATKSHDKNQQYLGFLLYIFAEAFIFLPMLYIATSIQGGEEILKQAALLTLSLFGGLSFIVIYTKKDFSFMRRFLTIGFFIALGLIGAGLLFGFNLGLWFSAGMIVLASGSILYQTSNMVHKYSEDQYVGASLGLFASLMLLFWYILSIFISRN